MTDKEFLSWVADRLVHVYGESQSVDFVHKLRKISQRTWVGLTDEDLANCSGHEVRWALYWDKLLKEKNNV